MHVWPGLNFNAQKTHAFLQTPPGATRTSRKILAWDWLRDLCVFATQEALLPSGTLIHLVCASAATSVDPKVESISLGRVLGRSPCQLVLPWMAPSIADNP